MRRILTFAAAVLLSLSAWGQTRTVSGTVLDAQQQPLVGAAVILSGTTNGEVTGLDGGFSLRVPAGDVTLEVSCLGYTTQSIVVPSTQATLNVTLEEDNMMLEETVVVGYGVQKKVNLTGAITAVDSKELADRTSHNLTTMLQGSVPGLNITTSAGNPGSTGALNIRGITSINEADPLVLIDGVEGDLSRINPNDVQSISVIKDASAAAIYGARAAYGVILVTTKSGDDKSSKATVRYSGRLGWEEPTVSTDFESRGYWHVYTVDKFWKTDAGQPYTGYTEHDMAEMLARVNDVTENPERPWVVEDYRDGRKQWIYYANTDWYHELYRDQHPVQQHNISITGGNKDVKYYISGAYDRQSGIIKVNPDVFQKYNLRAKIDARLNKFMRLSNNTSFFSSSYTYPGPSNVQNSFAYAARHGLSSFPLKNPDGSWLYATPLIIGGNYNVANGRHIIFGEGKQMNQQLRSDFMNTTELKITPWKPLTITANYTYRIYQNRNQYRSTNFGYRRYPDAEMEYYTTGAGEDSLTENTSTSQRHAFNAFATYDDSFAGAHHITATAGINMEYWGNKAVGAVGQNLLSETLNDLDLVGPDSEGNVITTVSGGQNEYAIMGFFGRINYNFKERYLLELSGRYDGTSRFQKGHQWGFFPSGSVGWRISEEPFFKPARRYVDNLKLRLSYGRLGNQVVRTSGGSQNYYAYLRKISINDFAGYTFGEGTTMSKYSTLSAPVDANLTWETSEQINAGLDLAAFNSRLTFTGELYQRKTLNMLTAGPDLPATFGADAPQTNAADLKTYGYELSLGWRDQISLFGKPFGYSVRGTLSDYRSYITRFNNKNKSLSMSYYEGMRIGDIWGFEVDGLFASDEEAKDYTANVLDCGYINSRMTGGFLAGDLRFVDQDNDGHYKINEDGQYVLDENGNRILLPESEWRVNTLGLGSNTVDDPGDRKILGNSLPSLQYGFTLAFDYMGFDVSAFFQGTGNHYWYPTGGNLMFWGPYSYSYLSFLQRDFIDRVWSEENPNTYFPRPRAYSSTGGELSKVNSRYLQNIRYLRFKNLTVGYTLPQAWTRKIGVEKARVYFSGENLAYWSPLKKNTKYLDPESAYTRNIGDTDAIRVAYNHMSYPWQKTLMFGIDITF